MTDPNDPMMQQSVSDEEIAECAQQVKTEILLDIANKVTNSKGETMPFTVGSFSELHDYVDANTYGGLCDDDSRAHWTTGDVIAVQDRVDAWLKRRLIAMGPHLQHRKDTQT